jgi:hypothetical protein
VLFRSSKPWTQQPTSNRNRPAIAKSFRPSAARKKRAELVANPDYVNKALSDGAIKAKTLAQTVLKRARKASGLE